MHNVNMLNHFRAVRDYTESVQLSAVLRWSDMHLEVSGNGRHFEFGAGFVGFEGPQLEVYTVPVPKTFLFSGWQLQTTKTWALAQDKRALKAYCAQHELRTPTSFRSVAEANRAFVIKSTRSATGFGVNGPYRAQHAASDGGPDRLIEEFVRGRVMCAWYWDGILAAVDAREMPSIVGDSRRTIAALLRTRRPCVTREMMPAVLECLSYEGLTLDSVLEEGRSVVIDVRFNSPAIGAGYHNENVLPVLNNARLVARLTQVGRVLWAGIPQELQARTLFTVTAIADANDELWVLDMDANPPVHPDAYQTMLGTLFGTPIPINSNMAGSA